MRCWSKHAVLEQACGPESLASRHCTQVRDCAWRDAPPFCCVTRSAPAFALSGSQCACYAGFTGADCSQTMCAPGCEPPRGECFNGTCHCTPSFGGLNCAAALCPSGCSGHGTCADLHCVCDAGCETRLHRLHASIVSIAIEATDCHSWPRALQS